MRNRNARLVVEVTRDYAAHCEHLVALDTQSDAVVGTYRILTPDAARRAGGYYGEEQFDLTELDMLRSRMVEVGRACVDPAWRSRSRLPSAHVRSLVAALLGMTSQGCFFAVVSAGWSGTAKGAERESPADSSGGNCCTAENSSLSRVARATPSAVAITP